MLKAIRSGKVLNLLKSVAVAAGIICITGSANAASLTRGTTFNTFLECFNDGVGLVIGENSTINGWQYAFDSNSDGVNGMWGIGAAAGQRNPYDIFGMAVKETADSIIVVLKGNMPLTGSPEASVASGQIGWGDLFFNLSGQDFASAMNSGDLFGIRFSDVNASGVSRLGVYGGVQAKTVTDIKNGYTIAAGGILGYENSVTRLGGTVGYGDLSRSYLGTKDGKFNLNAIASGNFLTDITFLAKGDVTPQLLATGYDTKNLAGAHTIAFKFNKSALSGATSIPEPASIISLAAIGLAIACCKQ
ncbi:XDD3 family exosortase-dependent surface protein [Microseira wollei]|uniref:PEP-CTERM protein-sorting domain-containing protein n=1 Tax=Microseira wollei NIES-4236 TaxID=2530354 RepID=A0AAV3XBG3_9CYAN|nr:XDD3 family exosortase-dependent surface protein [Microseira wollei]GET38716.1 hypothetical protein MiSe_34750 [Microseira wollei NIES-4236]